MVSDRLHQQIRACGERQWQRQRWPPVEMWTQSTNRPHPDPDFVVSECWTATAKQLEACVVKHKHEDA